MITVPPLVWKLLAGFLVAVSVAGGAAYAMHHHDNKVFQDYKDAQAAAAAKAALASAEKVRAAEQAAATAQQVAAQQAAVEKTENAKRTNATIASLRAGTLQLSSELASSRAKLVSQTAAGSSGPGADPARLPDDTAQFLVDEASRADNITIKYNEALAVIAQDRLTCSGVTQ